MAERYNGWKNYETWLTYTHLTNDELTQSYWGHSAKFCYRMSQASGNVSRLEQATFILTEAMESELRDSLLSDRCRDHAVALAFDLLTASVSEIDFREIAKAFLEGVEEATAN